MAANFRPTCGLEREAPEFSSHLFLIATPQVGQETEDTCLGVSSLFFILREMRLHAVVNLFNFERRLNSVAQTPTQDLSGQATKQVRIIGSLWCRGASTFDPRQATHSHFSVERRTGVAKPGWNLGPPQPAVALAAWKLLTAAAWVS